MKKTHDNRKRELLDKEVDKRNFIGNKTGEKRTINYTSIVDEYKRRLVFGKSILTKDSKKILWEKFEKIFRENYGLPNANLEVGLRFTKKYTSINVTYVVTEFVDFERIVIKAEVKKSNTFMTTGFTVMKRLFRSDYKLVIVETIKRDVTFANQRGSIEKMMTKIDFKRFVRNWKKGIKGIHWTQGKAKNNSNTEK